MAGVLTKILSDDPVLNRVQDQLAEKVNPLIRKLQIERPRISGSRGGNAALASLLDALDALGVITNDSVT